MGIVATATAIGAFGPLPGGPLELGGGITLCSDSANSPVLMTLAPTYAGASGVVTAVRLLGADGLLLEDVHLVPFADGRRMGMVSAADPARAGRSGARPSAADSTDPSTRCADREPTWSCRSRSSPGR